MPSLLLALVALVVVVVVVACAQEDPIATGRPCTVDSECDRGHCIDGRCQSIDPDRDASVDCERACGDGCCNAGERCFRGDCVDDLGTCEEGSTCWNDSECLDGVCVRWGHPALGANDRSCTRTPEPLGDFAPVVQCSWPPVGEAIEHPESQGVTMMPVVGDLDGDDVPEVVFASSDPVGSQVAPNSHLRAIRGDDCTTKWTSDLEVNWLQSPALGDLDGDGVPEVCTRDNLQVPVCFRGDGSVLWRGHDGEGADVAVGGTLFDVGMAMANVDGAGPPELVVGLHVFRWDGLLLRGRDVGSVTGAGENGPIPSITNIDDDAHLEATTGALVVDLATGEVQTTFDGMPEGFTAIADLAPEVTGPEIVVVSPSLVRVLGMSGEVLLEHEVPGGSGGPPTVADLDGDGAPEFTVVGHRNLTAFDLDCLESRTLAPDGTRVCAGTRGTGLLWSQSVQELTSGVTGAAVFDFEGDGPVEVVYADECWARVFDGKTGTPIFSAPHESGTWVEMPVVADADGDFFTEIVVPDGAHPAVECPAEDPLVSGTLREVGRNYEGIVIYRDLTDRWAPSRPLWSQHSEHRDQRSDDATVPPVEVPSWTTHNSWRQQGPRAGGTATDTPDLTVRYESAPPCDLEALEQPLRASVCNRGTLGVGPGIVVRFARRDDGGELCRAATTEAIDSGACVEVECTFEGIPRDTSIEIIASATLDTPECRDDNNEGLGEVRCPRLD